MKLTKGRVRIKIDLLMYLYIYYIMYVIINDYVTFAYGKKSNMVTYLISMIIIGIFIFTSRWYIELYKNKLSKIDYCAIAFFIILFLLRVCIPESAFDTLNYHLILQENPFAQYINYDFFPGKNINSFSYPLGDRIFYLFRLVFGYRMGISVNLFVVILSYLKIKELVYILSKKILNISVNNKLLALISIFCLYSEKIYGIMAIYYVDILYLPLILEVIILILIKEDEVCDNINSIYIGMICGIIVSLKITNAIYIVALYVVFIIKNHKKLKIQQYCLLFFVPLFPIFVYTLNIYVKTGSPIFPYYNSIFLSKYFANINWSDARFGPNTLIETIFWPIIIVFNPIRTSDLAIYTGRLSVAYIIAIVNLLYYLIKNKFSTKSIFKSFVERMLLIYILLNLLWSKFMAGYIRYALILEILASIIIMLFLIYLIKNIKRKIIMSTIKYALIICVLFNLIFVSKYIFLTNIEESWRQPIYKNIEANIKNIQYLFNDQDSGVEDELLDNIRCWGIVDYNSGYARLLKSDIPIISLNASSNNDLTKRMLNERAHMYNDGMYTIADNNTVDRVLKELNQCGYYVSEDIIKVNPKFIDSNLTLYLMKIRKNTCDNLLNSKFLINNENKEYSMYIEESDKIVDFQCIVGLDDVTKNWKLEEFNVDFYLSNNTDKTKVFSKKFYPNSNFEKIQFDINLKNYIGYNKLIVSVSSDNNKSTDNNWVDIINPSITYKN